MDWNGIEGNWKQLKGRAKEQWGQLTDDDLDVAAGQREALEVQRGSARTLGVAADEHHARVGFEQLGDLVDLGERDHTSLRVLDSGVGHRRPGTAAPRSWQP